jgi:hypothetical protein
VKTKTPGKSKISPDAIKRNNFIFFCPFVVACDFLLSQKGFEDKKHENVFLKEQVNGKNNSRLILCALCCGKHGKMAPLDRFQI